MNENHRPFEWDQARTFVRELYLRRAQSHERAQLDDVVQEACVRTLRAMRRQPAEQPWALLNTIAQRTWIDHQRRAIVARQRGGGVSVEDLPPVAAAEPFDDDLGDLRERIVLIAHEFFARENNDGCRKLLRAFVARLDWRQVADDEGISHAAVRKRWSRCLETLRGAFARDASLAPLLEDA